MTVSLRYTAQFVWQDKRLNLKNISGSIRIGNTFQKRLWKPTIWTTSIKDSKLSKYGPTGSGDTGIGMRVYNAASLIESTFYTKMAPYIKLDEAVVTQWREVRDTYYCKMDFTNYPIDRQNCKFMMVVPLPNGYGDLKYPDIGSKGLTISMSSSNLDYTTSLKISPGFYVTSRNNSKKVIECEIILERKPLQAFVETIMPTGLIVMMSWVSNRSYHLAKINEVFLEDYVTNHFQISFVVHPEMVPGRLGLIITLFLCMTNTLNSVAKSAPNSGSVSKIVSWMLACRSGHMNYSLITIYHHRYPKRERLGPPGKCFEKVERVTRPADLQYVHSGFRA